MQMPLYAPGDLWNRMFRVFTASPDKIAAVNISRFQPGSPGPASQRNDSPARIISIIN